GAVPTPTPFPAPPVAEPIGKGRRVSRFEGILFVLPALVVLGLFVVYPAYYTIRLSLYQSDYLFNFTHYVGLANFRNLLKHDPDFLAISSWPPGGALINNLRWVIFYISFSLVFGLGLAVLAVRVRYERVVKSVTFVPMAISATAVSIIWLFVYSPDPSQGVLNAILGAFGHNPIAWLGRPDTVNYALIFAYIWASTGFVLVVLSAALKGIPMDIWAADCADGANEWQVFWR